MLTKTLEEIYCLMLLGVDQPLTTLTNSLRVTKHLLSGTFHALVSEQWLLSKKDETSDII